MCRVLQVLVVFQGIKVLQVLQDPWVHPSPDHQDPQAHQDPKDLQGFWDLQVKQDQTVRVQSQGLVEILVVLGQMESQGVLVRWGIQVRTLPCLEMMGTTGLLGARGPLAQKDLRGPEDCQASLEIQELKACGGLQV